MPLYGARGVGNGLAFGNIAHKAFFVRKSHHGRGGAAAFRVGDAFGILALHDVNAGVGSTQVNTDNLGHMVILLGESFFRIVSRSDRVAHWAAQNGARDKFWQKAAQLRGICKSS